MNNRTEPKLVVLVSLVRKRVGTVILLPRMCLELFLMRGVVFKKYSLSTHYLLASNQTLCMNCFFTVPIPSAMARNLVSENISFK